MEFNFFNTFWLYIWILKFYNPSFMEIIHEYNPQHLIKTSQFKLAIICVRINEEMLSQHKEWWQCLPPNTKEKQTLKILMKRPKVLVADLLWSEKHKFLSLFSKGELKYLSDLGYIGQLAIFMFSDEKDPKSYSDHRKRIQNLIATTV